MRSQAEPASENHCDGDHGGTGQRHAEQHGESLQDGASCHWRFAAGVLELRREEDMESLIAELERIASSIEGSVGARDVSKLNDWGKGYHDAEMNFAAGLRERVRQLRTGEAGAQPDVDAATFLEQVAAEMASRASGYLMRTKDEPDLAQKACGLLEGAGMLRDKAKVIS